MDRRFVAIVALLVVATLAFLRDPSLWLEPRLWAEEGTHYFGSALQRGVLEGLLNVAAAPHNPYLHFVPTAATVVAAHALPLELAPYATATAWALVLLGMELVVLFGRARILEPVPVRILLALSPLIAVGHNENWVNTLGAHFYCDLALLLLLLEAPRVAGRRRAIGLTAFALFTLFSPTSWFLVPAALLLSILRERAHRPYLAILLVDLVLQAILALAVFGATDRSIRDAAALPHLFLTKLLLWPFLGHGAVDAYGAWALGLSPPAFTWAAGGAALVSAALVGVFLAASRRDRTTAVLLLTWLVAAGSFLFLGLSVDRNQLSSAFVGGRYAFFPAMLLVALLAHQLASPQAQRQRQRLRTMAFAALILCMLIVGSLEFSYHGIAARRLHGWPWREEVARFRQDPTYDELRIAPPGWSVRVPASAR